MSAVILDIQQHLLLLELNAPFDKRDVQLARRRMAKRWHPDLAPAGRQYEHEPFASRVPDHSVVHRYARCLTYPEWGVGSVTGSTSARTPRAAMRCSSGRGCASATACARCRPAACASSTSPSPTPPPSARN